jgi:NAD+ kinase
MQRIGLVVHPTRDIDRALATLAGWAKAHGIEVVQIAAGDATRTVAEPGEVDACDLVVAVGGDGTVLTALRAAAATETPVLGVACGSLGALSAVRADAIEPALDSFAKGDWTSRELHALRITGAGAAADDGAAKAWAINDFVLLRKSGQLVTEIAVDGELYARLAGDGVVVATALGSSAYSMAAGGPILVEGTDAFVVTPLVAHGGSAPPLVVRESSTLTLEAHPGYSGFDVEIDGHAHELDGTRFTVELERAKLKLVAVEAPGRGLTALRRRGLIADSPRVLARDKREPSPRGSAPPG